MFCTKKAPEIQWEKENKEEKICANILYLNDSNIQQVVQKMKKLEKMKNNEI